METDAPGVDSVDVRLAKARSCLKAMEDLPPGMDKDQHVIHWQDIVSELVTEQQRARAPLSRLQSAHAKVLKAEKALEAAVSHTASCTEALDAARRAEGEATEARRAAEAELVLVYKETAPPQVKAHPAPDSGASLGAVLNQLGRALRVISQESSTIPPASLEALRSLEALLPPELQERTPTVPPGTGTGGAPGGPPTEPGLAERPEATLAAQAAAEAQAAAKAEALEAALAAADAEAIIAAAAAAALATQQGQPEGAPPPGEGKAAPKQVARHVAPAGSGSPSFSSGESSEKRARTSPGPEETAEQAAQRLAAKAESEDSAL